MSRDYTIGAADADTGVAVNATAPNAGAVVKVPDYTDVMDGPKAFVEFANSMPEGGGGVTVSDTEPTNPDVGDQWFKSDTGKMYVYYGTAWIEASGRSGGAGADTSNKISRWDAPPADTTKIGALDLYLDASGGAFVPPVLKYWNPLFSWWMPVSNPGIAHVNTSGASGTGLQQAKAFNSTYENYQVVFNVTSDTAVDLKMRLKKDMFSQPFKDPVHNGSFIGRRTGANIEKDTASGTWMHIGSVAPNKVTSITLDVMNPNKVGETNVFGKSLSWDASGFISANFGYNIASQLQFEAIDIKFTDVGTETEVGHGITSKADMRSYGYRDK